MQLRVQAVGLHVELVLISTFKTITTTARRLPGTEPNYTGRGQRLNENDNYTFRRAFTATAIVAGECRRVASSSYLY